MEISGTLRKNDLHKWEIVGDDGPRLRVVVGLRLRGPDWRELDTRRAFEFYHGGPAVAGELPACGSPASHDGHYYAMAQLPARMLDDWFF
jgi:hypothetical protein